MKKYEKPEVYIYTFAIEDVLTTSSGGAWEDELPR